MMHTFRKNVQPEDLTRAKVIGITLATPGDKEGPIHRVTLDMKGRVTHQENTPEWGKAFLTFPPAFKDLSAIAKWSFSLLKDCYGYGDIIEQRVCVLELYTHDEVTTTSSKKMLKKIENNLRERMSGYTDSRQPTGNEIRIAWLVSEIDRLNKEVDKTNQPGNSSHTLLSPDTNYGDNQPVMLFITLTEDNKKEIKRQIQEGKRPQYWDTPGHPDRNIWECVLESHPEAGVVISI